MRRLRKAAWLALAMVTLMSSLLAQRKDVVTSKDDVITMKNGDKFTGEVKKLQKGKLLFKADYMAANVQLDWSKVRRVESPNLFYVTLADGRRFAAQIHITDGNKVLLEEAEITTEVSSRNVVMIQKGEATLPKQLSGSINYGFTFTGDNSELTSSLSSTIALNTAKDTVRLTGTSQFNAQAKGINTQRLTFTGEFLRKTRREWLYGGVFDALKSDQQELNLRTTYGGGIGRYLLQTDRSSILLLVGMDYSHENYTPQPNAESTHNNAEWFAGLRASTFRFRTLELNSQLTLLPSATDLGRVRLGSQSNAQVELVKDLFWNLNVYENFDSRPPIVAPRNDFGITTGFGWTF